MQPHEWSRFLDAMTVLYLAFDREPKEALSRIYWAALKDLSIEDIERAVRLASARLKFFPKPIELRELVQGAPEDRSALAWDLVQRAIEVGTYRSVVFEDPAIHVALNSMGGWMAFGLREDTDWTRKEFERLHAIATEEIRRVGIARARVQRHLVGRFEAENRSIQPVVEIGDAQRIAAWQAELEKAEALEPAAERLKLLEGIGRK